MGVGHLAQYRRVGLSTSSLLRCSSRRRDARQQVDQLAVVGHVRLEVRVRPVRAPQHAIRERLDDAARERHEVVVARRTAARQAFRAADLRPDVRVIAHQLHEQLEARRGQRLRHVRPTHVVDDDDRRKRGDELVQLRQILRFEVDDDVPAERLDALGDLDQHFARRHVDETLDEVEAHAAHAGGIELAELLVGEISGHSRDAARAAVRRPQRIDHRAIVGAVTRRLHDHVALEAEIVAQLPELLLRRVARRVLALRRIWKLVARTEDVTMRVDRAGRRTVHRLARRLVIDEPVAVHLEPAHRFLAFSSVSRRGYTRRAFSSKICRLSSSEICSASM